MEALKECPLCKESARVEQVGIWWSVCCDGCCLQIHRLTEAEAIRAWNSRSTPAPSNSPGIPDSSPAPVEDEAKGELERDCPICGKKQRGTYMHDVRTAAVYWHADGSPDCNAGEGKL